MDYRITDDKSKIKSADVQRLLSTTYWADKRPLEQIEKSMANSACFGILDDSDGLIGFARVISDFATTYYLCDVIIDSDYRKHGLGKELVSYIVSLPEYQNIRGILMTKDAHGLYEKYGFEKIEGRAMSKPVKR
ncbi:MAG: GNAT family N-acetyltransferase [Pseudobutyrivibrio sp.]|nr:GNAT family N-acetyltransferase [Pseudobutyrivibrio sp.]